MTTATSRNQLRIFASSVIVIAGILVGDIAIFAVAGFAKWLVNPLILQWLITVPIVALGGYILFGLPQIKIWSKGEGKLETDRRSRFAMRQLSAGHWFGFTVASMIGGLLVVPVWYARKQDPNARRMTFISAWIMAAFWSSLYLGIWHIIR